MSSALKWGFGLLVAATVYGAGTHVILRQKAERLQSIIDAYLQAPFTVQPSMKAAAMQEFPQISSEQFDTLVEQVRQEKMRQGIAVVTQIFTGKPKPT